MMKGVSRLSTRLIAMTVGILARLSEDEATRLAYSRRQDEITNYYATIQQLEDSLRRAEESDRRAEESDRRAVRAMRARNWTVADIAEALERPKKKR